jgi:hypothetical protein
MAAGKYLRLNPNSCLGPGGTVFSVQRLHGNLILLADCRGLMSPLVPLC